MSPLAAILLVLAVPALLSAQDSVSTPPRPSPAATARIGAEFRIPLASFMVPGMGQYLQGAPGAGAGFTGAAVAGYALYLTGDPAAPETSVLPHDPAGQQTIVGLGIVTAAGGLSAYDSFHRSLPALQAGGRYEFVTSHDSPGTLLLAPFDVRMLGRWTTWIDLAYTGAVTLVLVTTEKQPGKQYWPFRARDGAFVTSFSYTAGVGEEALFRGWLYPVLHQNTGGRVWLSNGLQAAVFGGLHVPQAKAFALVIASWAVYEGWLTRRNGWSVRESVFHHFWYDVAVGAATLMTQERATVRIAFPGVRF